MMVPCHGTDLGALPGIAATYMPECWNLADIADLESAAVRRARASRVSGTNYLHAAIYNICATREWMRGIELRTGIVPP